LRLTTVLIVSGGGYSGLALIKALQQHGSVRVLVADCFEECPARFVAHGFHKSPLIAQQAEFDGFLVALCERESVGVMFPATSHELATLARLKPTLEKTGVTVWVSAAAALALDGDKRAFYAWLARERLPALPACDAPDEALHGGPWIGKPIAGWGGNGMVRVASAQDVAQLSRAQRSGLVWQPCLESFDEYSIDFSVDMHGVHSPLWVRRRIRTLGGFAVLCEPASNAEVHSVAQATVAALAREGARGMLNLQVLVDADGRPWVSDFNARIGTSMPLTLAAGGNPISWLFGELPSDAVIERPPSTAVRTVRLMHERRFMRPALQGVRGVVFDLDDTLIDQKAWMMAKLKLLWQGHQHELPCRAEFLAAALHIIEEGERARLLDVLALRFGLNDGIRMSLIEAYRAALPDQCPSYDDVAGILAQLRSRGLLLALLSDNPPSSQRDKLARSQLPQALDAIVLTGEIPANKPDRAAFEAVCGSLDLRASELVMVGDNMVRDTQGALAAGYAHAFHIQRPGAFFNHSLGAWRELMPQGWTELHSLVELDWHLDEVCA
jgi:FMN phosphatase YigB (HAD superfamily)